MNTLSYRNAQTGAFVRYAHMLLLALFAALAPMPFSRILLVVVCIGVVIANTLTHAYMTLTKRIVLPQYLMLAVDLAAVYTGIYFTGMLTSPFLTMLPLFFFNIWFVDFDRRVTLAYGATAVALYIGLAVLWWNNGEPGADWFPGRYPAAALYFVTMQAATLAVYIFLSLLANPMYEELNRQEAALAAQRRRAELGGSLAMVAHEIRTPLTSIRLAVNLARRARNRTGAGKNLARAEGEVAHIDAMLESLLSRNRDPGGRIETCRVADLADRAVEFIRLKYGRRVPFHFTRDDGAGIAPGAGAVGAGARIKCDPAAMHQAFVNILDNSVKARTGDRPLRIEVRSAVKVGAVTVTIRDNGRGMSREVLARLFDRFAPAGPGGTGLGLHIAKQTIEKHGGTIKLDSVEGAGTTAVITLPATGRGRGR